MLKRIAGAAVTIAVLALTAACVWFMCFSPYKVYIVHTGSMEPTISVRSAEIVHVGQYRIGQVISYHFHGEVITHRLIGIARDGTVTTKGDANASPDPWHVKTTDIIGQVVMAPRYVGWWLVYFQQPSGIISAVLTILVIWLLWDWLNDESSSAEPA